MGRRLSNMRGRIQALGGRRGVVVTLAVALVVSALVVVAVRSDGSVATNVRLDDGSVWVANNDAQRVGRLNVRINELDFAVASASTGGDVIQDARAVMFTGLSGGVQRVDVVSGQTTGDNAVPIAQYQVNGGVGLVLDSLSGNLWVGRSQSIVAPEFPEKPDAVIGSGSIAVVTHADPERRDRAGQERGRVLVVEPGGWYELLLDDDLEPVRQEEEGDPEAEGSTTTTSTTGAPEDEDVWIPDPIAVPEIHPLPPRDADVEAVTTVGARLVVLYTDGDVVVAPTGEEEPIPVQVPGEDIALQQPGPVAKDALVASTAGLFELSLADGILTQIATADAAPAAPVRVGECVFGAWSGEEPVSYKRCGSTVLRDGSPIPNAAPHVDLVFRVNQTNVALNSPGDGGVWADHEGILAYVGNWADLEDLSRDTEEIEETVGDSLFVTERTCVEGGDIPPQANDDTLELRPRQSIIDVLYNDDDANCEPIAVVSVEPIEGDWGNLTVIGNGQHILYSPGEDMIEQAGLSRQDFEFAYVVADAAGNESTPATVTVIVKDHALGNTAPQLRPKGSDSSREMRTVVEEGRAVSYDVLADWWDRDGDDLRLVAAHATGAGETSFTPDGIVRYAAYGVAPGIQVVDVTVSDGERTATESMEVTIKPAGSPIPPVTSYDFVTVSQGSSGVVLPLANDSDPNEQSLSLRPQWPTDHPGFRTRMSGDAVEVTGVEPGVYRLDYEAFDGTDATPGSIRVEVLTPSDSNQAPIAVPDQVKVRVDRVVNVDVLANDIDRDGDLLAVTGVDAGIVDPSEGVVRAGIVDRRMLQIEVVRGPTGELPSGPFTIRYTIDDGHSGVRASGQSAEQNHADALRASGALTILIQPPGDDQPPEANDDEAIVRQGGVVAVPVLRNDTDPDADELTLESVDADRADELELGGQGVAWVEGRYVYYQGGEPGRYTLPYTISAAGRRAVGEVTLDVKPPPHPEDNPNQAPEPPDLTLRAVRNGEVRLQIPTSGIDADGDPVAVLDEFTGLEGAGQGNRVFVDPDSPGTVIFAAGAGSPPADSFMYTVQDPYGARGTARVAVMVLDDLGWPPQAHDDVLRGRPGRTLSIPVLANDSSPQDRRLELAELPFFDAEGQPTAQPTGESVRVLDQTEIANHGRIEVVVPDDGSTLTEHYRMTDGRNPGDAFVRVTPDPEAPNVPPVATPDVVEIAEILDQEEVSVDVLVNDFDPDDAGSPLTLSMPAHQNGAVVDGTVVVTLEQQAQTVLYRITDGEGATAVGRITVPGLENHPPVLSAAGRNRDLRRIEAGSTEPLEISLPVIVEDPDGDPDIQLTPSEVRVLGGLGEVSRHDDGYGFTYTPPPDQQFATTVAIQFEVTDRPEQDPLEWQLEGCNCLAVLVVELVLEASSPPRVLGPGAVQVPQLDEPVEYDLSPLVIDDQDDPLTFEVDLANTAGLTVTQNGSTITLVSERERENKIPVGTSIPIRYSVTDENFEPVEGMVNVTIITTNRGQPAAANLPEQDAVRDAQFQVPNLVDAASNPFPDRPLLLESYDLRRTAGVEDGGQYTVTCQENGACTFLSYSVGAFELSYVLRDAVDQTANGSLTIVVKGVPRAPGTPREVGVGDKEVTLAWSEADMQGGEFVSYIVTATEVGQATTLTQTFDEPGGVFNTRLVNGRNYTFTVVAENELGPGETSSPSQAMMPDRVPSAPENLTISDYGDSTLTLEWDPPSTQDDHTPIEQYEIEVTGNAAIRVDVSPTTVVVGAQGRTEIVLNNGDAYRFRVRAQNAARVNEGWGDWSGFSAPETPSRYPDPPTNVRVVNTGDGGQPRLRVTWDAPGFNGGRPIQAYKVCPVDNPGCPDSDPSLERTFAVDRNVRMQYTVVAINSDKNRDNSDPSVPSDPVTAVGHPDAPVISSVTSGDHTLTVNASMVNNSGCDAAFNVYSLNNGDWQESPTFNPLTNGTTYTARARTRLSSECGTPGVVYESGSSNAVDQTPYGPLQTPTISAEVSGNQIRWHWNTRRSDDRRPGWTATLASTTGGTGCDSATLPSTEGGASGTTSWKTIGYSTNGGCRIAISADGASSITRTASATTSPPPAGSLSVSRGSQVVRPADDCPASANCKWVTGSGSGWEPGVRYHIGCLYPDGSRYFVNTETGIPAGVVWAPRFVDNQGRLSWGENICFSGFTHNVRVWTVNGASRTVTANWP